MNIKKQRKTSETRKTKVIGILKKYTYIYSQNGHGA